MSGSTKTGSRSPSRLLPLMMLAVLGAGCTQQRQPSSDEQVDNQVLAEDARAMARRYAQWQQSVHSLSLKTGINGQMPLDLSDELQYRFVLNRLKASGLSPQNAPRLFAHLDLLHRKGGNSSGSPLGALASTSNGAWCGHMISLGESGSDATQSRFEGTGLTSCFGGSDYSIVDFKAFATDEAQTSFELLASDSYEEYAGKVLETAPVSVSLHRQAGKQLLFDSLAMAFNEETGQEHLTYTSVTATPRPSLTAEGDDFILEHPRELLDEKSWDKTIRLCLERGSVHGFLDCDYGSVRIWPDGRWQPFPGSGATGIAAVDAAASKATTADGGTPTWVPDKSAYWTPKTTPYDPSHFQVPTRGKFVPRVLPECQVTNVTSKVAAILTESGGWCEASTAPGTVIAKGELPWQSSTAHGEFPFNGILDFGSGNCLDNAQSARLEIWVYAEGSCPNPFGGEPEPFRSPSKKVVQPVDYKRLCMAEGTQVTKADGKTLPVEKVKVGDKLLANGKGLALTVTTVHRGGESHPLVKLRDDQGHEVQVTDTHPMVTAKRGVVQAGELKVGEAVLTSTGARKLVAVERVPYNGLVYNFSLGTPEELAKAGPEARTLYANGFLVGDSQLQTELEKQKRVDAREVLARLNGAWHEDFRRSQARRESARR